MLMKILYSNILPLGISDTQQTFSGCFYEMCKKSDRIEIAVGYVSGLSLEELDRIVQECDIKNICLNIGMYFIEGIPESIYHYAKKINEQWQNKNIGEIRLINAFKYHGKLYCFYKNGKPFAAIIGSANLGAIKLEANNRRQYEIATVVEEQAGVNEIAEHIKNLKTVNFSINIADIKSLAVVREKNTALNGIELVTEVPKTTTDFYSKCKPVEKFPLPLKVPKYAERHLDDNKHYTKSNINVCYAAPRSKHKARDWYETQLTVGSDIYKKEGYPEKNKPFFVATDDGYWFKAHTTSANNKQFSAVGDELIMGRWLKGRLAAAGLVKPVNNTLLDTDRTGMITQEILDEYGRSCLIFMKTGQTALDENGNALDVWYLSFEADDNNS